MAISRKQKFKRLNWLSPKGRLPHGLSGIVSVSSGVYLILHSISGRLDPYKYDGENSPIPVAVLVFVVSTCINALAGYNLTRLAWVETQSIFKRCAILQMCLSYYVLRFMPHFSNFMGHYSLANMEQHALVDWKWFIFMTVQMLDVSLCIIMMTCTLSFNMVALDFWTKSPSISASVAIGTVGILLLSTYPLHLALWGQEEWWMCIQGKYTLQNVGMVAYIYVPATVTFSLMLFGATLYMRGILSDAEYGMGSALVVLVCLLGTVLSQELHIPDVSTQRIYLPCQEPERGTWEADMVKAMDFSRYARRILTSLLGVEFENNLYDE